VGLVHVEKTTTERTMNLTTATKILETVKKDLLNAERDLANGVILAKSVESINRDIAAVEALILDLTNGVNVYAKCGILRHPFGADREQSIILRAYCKEAEALRAGLESTFQKTTSTLAEEDPIELLRAFNAA
jgi:hypothetical protein